MIRKLSFLMVLLILCYEQATAQMTFSSFEEFMDYASSQSLDLTKSEIELSQAKKAKLAAILSIVDPTGNIGLTYRNNTELPVTLVPSELLGGPSGSIEEVQFGLQYETQFAFTGELKLFNLPGWSNYKLSKINIALSENQIKLKRKELYENAAAIYYNILTLQAQQKSVEFNALAADTINQNVALRFHMGLASQQDVNESTANLLKIKQSAEQIHYQLKQQYSALKILCDIPSEEQIILSNAVSTEELPELFDTSPNQLLLKQAQLNEQYALSFYRKNKFMPAPTLSLIYYDSRQQFSNASTFLDNHINWIPSNYVGLRLSIPLPSSGLVSNYFSSKYNYLLAQQTLRQERQRVVNQAEQLENELYKVLAIRQTDKQIYQLKRETYTLNLISYEQGIINLSQTLTSFQHMINAEYSLIASNLAVSLAQKKIEINNNMQ